MILIVNNNIGGMYKCLSIAELYLHAWEINYVTAITLCLY